MTDELKAYERAIKKEHRFGWTLKYEEQFQTDLTSSVFAPIVIATFEALDWEVRYQDIEHVEGHTGTGAFNYGYQISVKFQYGKIIVKSVSESGNFWDNGHNSKRVKLFIYAFKQIEKTYDRQALAELEEEVTKSRNWDDYEIPATLPPPKERKATKFWVAAVIGVIAALSLGGIIAFLSVQGFYFLLLYELLVGLVIGWAFKLAIRASNYTNFDVLHYLLIGVVLLVYTSNQYFQYLFILAEGDNIDPIGMISFLKLRLEVGLLFDGHNTGWIGLVISWILQLVITYYVAKYRLASVLLTYQMERVPTEVIDYTCYYLVKGYSESQLRGELAKMNWTDEQDQNDVFAAVAAIGATMEMNKMEE